MLPSVDIAVIFPSIF